ncbi:MAG: PEP-CTERM sorting domain-containing protein [Alphaproteobacteria bacterium]|nr:PEP-CTERM sorting domain-containing protein [Alphaproteobacteria bacterium]MCB9928387.1 PEP-CTERM sorting domain-containing protein [Alphaproteobacteria bacterium]
MRLRNAFAVASAALALGFAAPTHAATILAMKVSDLAPAATSADGLIDPYQDWLNAGGHNEGVAGATSLTNNGIDYKNSFVDSNWGDVQTVRVAVYSGGVEQIFIEFDASGTDKGNFFAASHLTASTYGLASFAVHNFFSIPGDPGNDRHWFVERNYGGCGNDRGLLVVMDGADSNWACSWEESRDALVGIDTRAFLYALPPVAVDADVPNWNTGPIGTGDVFAVFVTTASVPEPATFGLLAVGAIGLTAAARRRRA